MRIYIERVNIVYEVIRKSNSIHRKFKIKNKIKYWNNKKEIRRKGKQITNMFFCGCYASWNYASSQGDSKFNLKVGEMSVNSIFV